jgi:imidazolonepropionase
MIRADLLVRHIGELATLVRGPIPRAGPALEELSIRRDAAIAVADGRFLWVGRDRNATRSVRLRRGGRLWDAEGGCVLPGFVDAHTHLLFGGDRSFELPLKIRGMSYAAIARRGGGIFATVRATRTASDAELLSSGADRLGRMVSLGSTTVEVKSGYALDHSGEIRLLRLIPRLARRSGVALVPTYLGAHAVPPRWARDPDGYVREIVRRTLPVVARERLARFCDVFCEPGFFTVAQSERILRAAAALGLGLKVHADEFVWSGGAALASRLPARSAEHLLSARTRDIRLLARAGVTAVLLPTTPFASFYSQGSPGRALVDGGVPIALGTDCSPNAWVESMPLVLAHAVYGARLTPQEAITAATVNAAHAIGAADRAGIIAVGRPADFVLFDLPQVADLPYRIGSIPTAVFRQGILRSPPRVRPYI